MGFSRQEYWSGLPCPPPGDLPDPGIESASSALAGGFFTIEPPGKPRLQVSEKEFSHLPVEFCPLLYPESCDFPSMNVAFLTSPWHMRVTLLPHATSDLGKAWRRGLGSFSGKNMELDSSSW